MSKLMRAGIAVQYGSISFRCLVIDAGRVPCLLNGYRFDYGRVVLLPAFEALASWVVDSPEDVFGFAASQEPVTVIDASSFDLDDDDPIERMIDMCNPCCIDCGEYESGVRCASYVFDGERAHF